MQSGKSAAFDTCVCLFTLVSCKSLRFHTFSVLQVTFCISVGLLSHPALRHHALTMHLRTKSAPGSTVTNQHVKPIAVHMSSACSCRVHGHSIANARTMQACVPALLN